MNINLVIFFYRDDIMMQLKQSTSLNGLPMDVIIHKVHG